MQVLIEKLDEKLEPLLKQQKIKDGAKLSQTDLNSMKPVQVPFHTWKDLKTSSSVTPSDVVAMVESLSASVEADKRSTNNGDEEENVKPKVKGFLTNDLFALSPYTSFVLVNEVPYEVTISDRTIVRGETDHLIRSRDYSYVSAGIFESKNSREKLEQPKHIAQFIVELFGEHFKILDSTRARPDEICGVMTNGKNWVMGRSTVYQGNYLRYYACSTRPEEIAQFLIHMLEVGLYICRLLDHQFDTNQHGQNADASGDDSISGHGGDEGGDEGDGGGDEDNGDKPNTAVAFFPGNGDTKTSSTGFNHSASLKHFAVNHFIAKLTAENLARFTPRG